MKNDWPIILLSIAVGAGLAVLLSLFLVLILEK